MMATSGGGVTGPLLHPMSLGDILDGAFRIYRANFKTLLIIVFVIDTPFQFANAFLQRNDLGGQGFLSYINSGLTQQTSTTSAATTVALLGLSAANVWIVQPFAGAAVSRVTAASYLGQVETAGGALRALVRASFFLLVAEIIVHLAEWVTGAFMALPGLIFMAMFVSVSPAIVIERRGPFAGLGRSWDLSRGRMWAVMGVMIVCWIVIDVVGSVIADPFTIVAALVGLRWGFILVFIGGMASAVVTLALNGIVATLLYLDGRVRHEGFDLQILARGVGV